MSLWMPIYIFKGNLKTTFSHDSNLCIWQLHKTQTSPTRSILSTLGWALLSSLSFPERQVGVVRGNHTLIQSALFSICVCQALTRLSIPGPVTQTRAGSLTHLSRVSSEGTHSLSSGPSIKYRQQPAMYTVLGSCP